jgi:DNA polymerase-3 subunit beta
MAVDEKGGTLEVQCGRTLAHVRGSNGGEFPELPEPAGEPLTRFEAGVLADGVGRVAHAVADEPTRPSLSSLLMRFEGTRVTLVGANGFCLAEYSCLGVEPVGEPCDLLVPRIGVKQVRGLRRDETVVWLDEGRRHVFFDSGETQIACELVGGSYPDYKGVIPTQWDVRAIVEGSALRQACKAAQAMNDGSVAVLVRFEPGKVTVSSSSCSGEGKTELEAEVEGEEEEVAISARYLIEAVGATVGKRVAIEKEKGLMPIVVRPVAGEDGGTVADQVGVIMPICQD